MKIPSAISLLLMGLIGCTTEHPTQSTNAPVTAPEHAKQATAQPQQPIVKYTTVGGYRKGERYWRTIVVKSPISDADLVTLANHLHNLLGDESIRIFDDATGVKAYENWDQNYPDDAYPYPEQWVRKHHVATINKMLVPGGATWQLLGGSAHPTRPESRIADLQ